MARAGECRDAFASDAAPTSCALFSACATALARTVGDEWYPMVVEVALMGIVYLLLALCVLCGTCRHAARAHRRRKKDAFELQMLRAAESEKQ